MSTIVNGGISRNGIEPLPCQLYYRALLTALPLSYLDFTGIAGQQQFCSCHALHYAVFKSHIVLPPIYTPLFYPQAVVGITWARTCTSLLSMLSNSNLHATTILEKENPGYGKPETRRQIRSALTANSYMECERYIPFQGTVHTGFEPVLHFCRTTQQDAPLPLRQCT